MSIAKAQHQALEDGIIDLLGDDLSNYQEVKLSDTENTLIQIAAKYIDLLSEKINEKDISSSGFMADNIQPTDVEFDGSTYTIGITAPEYANYQDEGVNGWAVNRSSRFSFRTRGVDPKGEMVKSIKKWIQREGSSSRNVKQGISSREVRGKSMLDASTRAAVSASFMIKRQGIKATHFWRDATNEMESYIENELGTALKIDIVNNLTP
jgi:hypothetical protein